MRLHHAVRGVLQVSTRGAPGPGDVLQNTGRTVLYEQRGAISTGPENWMHGRICFRISAGVFLEVQR
jgi:hypothetical protein